MLLIIQFPQVFKPVGIFFISLLCDKQPFALACALEAAEEPCLLTC